MSILEFVTLVDEGREIEFVYEGGKYPAAYCKINEKIMISFANSIKTALRLKWSINYLILFITAKKYLI